MAPWSGGNLLPPRVQATEQFVANVTQKPCFVSRSSLGRPFAGCFGCIALATSIVLGLLKGDFPDSILTQAVTYTVVYSALGWVLGNVGDQLVRQSVEMNYRERFEKLRQANKKPE